MFAAEDPNTGAIIIAVVVGLFGTLQVWIQRKGNKETKHAAAEAKVAVKEVAVETAKVAEATTEAATNHAELLLAKHDQVIHKLATLSSTVERNRAQNQREHLENQARIQQVAEGQEVLFAMIADVDKKVTKSPRSSKPPRIEVDVVSVPGDH